MDIDLAPVLDDEETAAVARQILARVARRAPGNNNTRTRMKNDAREQLIG
jgi:hypothetical protein